MIQEDTEGALYEAIFDPLIREISENPIFRSGYDLRYCNSMLNVYTEARLGDITHFHEHEEVAKRRF